LITFVNSELLPEPHHAVFSVHNPFAAEKAAIFLYIQRMFHLEYYGL